MLRTYEHQWEGNTWTWERDYVYRDGVPMASIEPDGAGGETTLHLHVDHLGSIRQIIDAAGSQVAYHSYYPFGGEAVSTGSDEVKLKFTGHERDESGGVALDYMHARYCSPVTGRFLSVDPLRRASASNHPQSWNRYSYAGNLPLNLVDPDGRCAAPSLNGGQVGVCIEAFIASKRIGGVGFGDGRSFAPNNPEATARVSLKMVIEPKTGRIVGQSLTPGISEVGLLSPMIGLKGSAEMVGGQSVTDGGTTFDILISAENGFSRFPGAPQGVIGFHVNFSVSGDGAVIFNHGATKGFPSLEGYAYRMEGDQLRVDVLFQEEETYAEELKYGIDERID